MVLSWLLGNIWKVASDEMKSAFADNQIRAHVKLVLADYEKVIEEARVKGLDGYTEEEKADIRKKKTELEERLMNETTP
jgi:hypothetical protein